MIFKNSGACSWGIVFGISGLVAVALGAFGAHALRDQLSPAMLEIWQTAVQYQFAHTLALGLVTVLLEIRSTRTLHFAAALFAAGILLFSGSLYALSLTGMRVLGAITPLGGLAFLAGWVYVIATFCSKKCKNV